MRRNLLRPELDRAAATLARAAEDGSLYALAVTAAARGEGVTTITAHLAQALVTDIGLRVLLVDLAGGKQQLAAGFAEPPPPLAEAAVAASTARLALTSLAAGDTEATLGLRRRLDAVLAAARTARFDLVLVDAPPLPEGLGAMVAAGACGQALLVIRAGNLPHEAIERVRDDLAEAGIPVFGAILNQRREVVPGWIDRLLR